MKKKTQYIGEFKVIRVAEAVADLESETEQMNGPEVVAKYFRETIVKAAWFDPEKEFLAVIPLDTRSKPKGFNLVSLGSLNESVANPREIFRPVIVSAAYAFIMIHNHPSGDVSPSHADISVTKKIRESAAMLEIPLYDHVIVPTAKAPAGTEYFSFREMGLL